MHPLIAQDKLTLERLTLADSLLDSGKSGTADSLYLQILKEKLTDSLQLKIISNRALALFKQERDDAAFELLQAGIAIAEKKKRSKTKADFIYRRTYFWAVRGEDRKAYSSGMEGIGITEDPSIMGKLYNLIGNSATNLGLQEEAMDAYFKSLDAKIKANASDLELSRTYLNLGGVLAEGKKQDEALRYYIKSAELKKIAKDSAGLGRLYGNIAILYKNKEQYKMAITYLDSALLFSPSPAAVDHYSILMTRAQIFKRQGLYEEADQLMKKALAAALEAKNKYRLTDVYINLSDLSNNRSAYREAIKFGNMADSLALTTRSFTQLMHLQSNLSTAWKGLGNAAMANKHLELAYQWKDSVYKEEQVFAMESMQVRYETALKDKQLAEQEIILKESGLELLQRKWIIVTLVLLLLLLITVFAFFQQKGRQRQMKLIQEAETERVKTVMRVTEQERSRIAADIHDGLGQIVTSLRLQLLKDKEGNNAVPLVQQLQEEIRMVAFDLMPAALTKGGLVPALSEYSHFVEKNTGLPIRFHSMMQGFNGPDDQQVHIYRIVQEWINNIVKYAEAGQIELQLSSDTDSLLVTIEDNGKGFDPEVLSSSHGQGWTNINTRAKLIGGTVWVDAQAGKKGSLFTLEIRKKAA